ncbi:zeta toxin family protein [Streptomyces sp. BH097]|uniref:zeta toxin family protein n=1 Tax=unclassified Streptomyces TaxID=2593676 RepID=UPI003BB72825
MSTAPLPLPAAAHREVLAERILPRSLQGAMPQRRPVAVVVAGQPGAGKTTLADLLHAALDRRGGAVRVSRDLYKSAHDAYPELLAADVRTAGSRVRPDTQAWQRAVEEAARQGRFDVVVESALADPDEFREQATALRAAGYRIEVVALAIPEAVSQLGVLDRYLRAADENRRFVAWENHDTCAAGMLRTLDVIEREQLADRICVVRRGAVPLYDNERTDGAWQRAPRAVQVVADERARPWDAQETAVFRRELADADRRVHHGRLDDDQRLAVVRDAERAAAWSEPVRRTAQVRSAPPGVDYHRLSAEEHGWIFENLIVPGHGDRAQAQEQPVAVYVVGQPGAGKTAATQMVRRAMRMRRAVWLTGDHFKSAHPDYGELLRSEPRTAGERIRADYKAWQAKAEAYVRERRGDMVIEMAPGSVGQFTASADACRQAGYRIELVVLAVRLSDSRQGTAARYADALRRGVAARFTTGAGHDQCVKALEAVTYEAETMVDAVTVLRRDGSALWHNTRGTNGQWKRAARAAAALVGEQHRPYTDEEARRFVTLQQQLRFALPQHRDEIVQISRLAAPLLPERRLPRRLPTPAPVPRALPLPAGYFGSGASEAHVSMRAS